MTLAERCDIHGDKMDEEGFYVTAHVLWNAAEALKALTDGLRSLQDHYHTQGDLCAKIDAILAKVP